ncbi:uncharacterized protein LOC110450604 [Mizuhopecten yessoensis]|uniref:uncharacterized protein LOC110450604 n=1 Tax=Mizuhopecten yessoensis TaxID=6573 RepID=UPI000B458D17|nr:uncharacterized protein LOC110450604 [Mizuhopecten yessoensis]
MPRRSKRKERRSRHEDPDDYDYTYDNAYSGPQYPSYHTPDYNGYGGTLKGTSFKTWDPLKHQDNFRHDTFPNMFGTWRSRSDERIKDSSSGSSRRSRKNLPLIISVVVAMVAVLVIIGVALGLLVFTSDSSPSKTNTGSPEHEVQSTCIGGLLLGVRKMFPNY